MTIPGYSIIDLEVYGNQTMYNFVKYTKTGYFVPMLAIRVFEQSELQSYCMPFHGHCAFAPQVFRHNNPHFQRLQSWAGLRLHRVSDKFIIYCNKTISISFSCINIRMLNLIKITAKLPLKHSSLINT